MLRVGWHHLPGGEAPGDPLGAATFLDLAPTQGLRCRETLVRPYFTGRPAPQEIARTATAWHDRGCRIQIGNEPNLPAEGFQGGPAEYGAWFLEVANLCPAGTRLYYAGMSPSGDWRDWYTHPLARSAIARSSGLCIHAYGTFDQMRATVDALVHLEKPIWLGEVNFGAGQTVDVDRWADQHFRPFLDWCSSMPQIEAACYFAYRWPTPDLSLPTPVDGLGTAVERVLRAWTPPQEAPVDPAHNPWRGKILTVWNLPADPIDLIAAGHALKLDGFEIKTADGNSSWLDSPTRHVTRAYCDALRGAGFRVLGWSYNYCDGLRDAGDRGDGVPEEEAAAAIRGVDVLALDGHTFDLEIECEGHPANVARLLDLGRADIDAVGAHVWADLAGHSTYPAAEILAGVDVLRPMIYRPTWNAERCWQSWGALFAGDPPIVCPVWGITEGTAPELAEDMAVADLHEVPGEAYWEWTAVPHLSPAVRALIAGRSLAAAPAVFDVEAARGRLWTEADSLEQHGYPWFAAGVKAAVAQSKGDK